MNVRLALATLTILAVCACSASAQPKPASNPRVLAKVGSFNITPGYFDYVLQSRYAREIMDEIIRARVIEDEAVAQRLSISSEGVTAEIEREKANFASEEDFAAHLQEMGFTAKGYREHVRTQLLLRALLDTAAAVSDADAKKYYEAHPAEFGTQPQLHILDIVTATQQDAIAAYRAVLDGTPFEVVAHRFNLEGSPGKDGDLGWVTKDNIPVKGLWDFAQALNVNDTSEPFEVEGKLYIVRLAGRREGVNQSFETAKDQIKTKLRSEKGLSEADYVTGLLAKAKISVTWAPVAYLEGEYQSLKGIRVSVDDRFLRLTPGPFITKDGALMIPAKPVLQAIGATLKWRPGAKVMEVTRGKAVVTISLGEKTAVVGGEFQDMKAPAMMKDEVAFIPPRAVLAALGVTMRWNPTTRVLAITTKKPE